MTWIDIAIIIISVLASAVAVIIAIRKRGTDDRSEAVVGRSLGPIVLALGAGATANSGFVLTGAVGLGYSGGLMWCLLPLGWLIGDIIFWTLIAKRVYTIARNSDAVTLPEIIRSGVTGVGSDALVSVVAIIIVGLMTVYVTSQWLSAGKVGGIILGLESYKVAFIFASVVIFYTALAGVRGAAYTDFVQACFMLALVISVFVITLSVYHKFNVDNAPNIPGFLSLTGTLSPASVVLMLMGFAFAAIGFNLGQPQMVNRWLSANSETTIETARWIYIAFVQITWLSYTALGTFIRLAVEVHVQDPEQALVAFIQEYGAPGMLGMLIAGAVSTIASTASATIATCVEIIKNDVAHGSFFVKFLSRKPIVTLVIGFLSLLGIFHTGTTVFSAAITAVSLIGAALAAPVFFSAIRVRASAIGTMLAVIGGLIVGIVWRQIGLDSHINESAPGMGVGIIILIADLSITRILMRIPKINI